MSDTKELNWLDTMRPVQKLVDRFALTHFMPGSDDLTDYLRSIVDACVKAATEAGQ